MVFTVVRLAGTRKSQAAVAARVIARFILYAHTRARLYARMWPTRFMNTFG